MKKIFTLSLILCIAILPLAAQETQSQSIDFQNGKYHNMSFSMGINPASHILLFGVLIEPWIAIGESLSGYNRDNYITYGNYSLNYSYQFGNNLRLGCKYMFFSSQYSTYDKDTQQPHSKRITSVNTLLPSLQYVYVNKDNFRMYSGVDLGGAVYTLDYRYYDGSQRDTIQNILLPALNLTIFGFNIGEKVYLNGEFNIGFDALIKLGVGIILNPKQGSRTLDQCVLH